jgi:hypothetical protein
LGINAGLNAPDWYAWEQRPRCREGVGDPIAANGFGNVMFVPDAFILTLTLVMNGARFEHVINQVLKQVLLIELIENMLAPVRILSNQV